MRSERQCVPSQCWGGAGRWGSPKGPQSDSRQLEKGEGCEMQFLDVLFECADQSQRLALKGSKNGM
eukprot:2893943-Amphidinium_carterae.1